MTYEEMQQRHAEIKAKASRLKQQLIESYADDIKELHPEMGDEAVSEMAEKTLNALVPEGANLKLGEDTIEGEVIEED